ncbi:hypothetical protein C0J52_27931 [Blattella germanica]|nr:hypothetical protein C0J52_27931 [Blattella germanica]
MSASSESITTTYHCKRCQTKAVDVLHCINCENCYHKSCATYAANVKILDDNKILCCETNTPIIQEKDNDIEDDNSKGNDDVDEEFVKAVSNFSDNDNKIDMDHSVPDSEATNKTSEEWKTENADRIEERGVWGTCAPQSSLHGDKNKLCNNMGRKPPLSDVEKGKVLAYKDQGFSSREIARRIERSPWVVNNFLKHGHDYGKKKSPGRPRKLSSRQERTIIRQLSAGGTSLGKLAKEPNINKIRDSDDDGDCPTGCDSISLGHHLPQECVEK